MFELPYSLPVNGVDRPINCDFRDVLQIFSALNDPALSMQEKNYVLLYNLYVDDFSEFVDIEEAYKQAQWFFDGGKDLGKEEASPKKILDWKKDYPLIIQAINPKVKTAEDARDLPFLHWWTFLGYFAERGECQLSTILNIREKLAKNQKLEKWEQELLRDNKSLIVLDDEIDSEFEAEIWGGEG